MDVVGRNDHVPLQWVTVTLSPGCWVLKFFSFFCKITVSSEHLLRSPSFKIPYPGGKRETSGGTTNVTLLVPCSKYLIRIETGPQTLSTIDIQNLTVTVTPKHRPPTIFAAASSLGLVFCMGQDMLGIRWPCQTANVRESSRDIPWKTSI